MEKDPQTRSVRRIAPLNPLRAFEAAARYLSFTQAADELCVTQGAVSRSVKALEDYMGSRFLSVVIMACCFQRKATCWRTALPIFSTG